MWKQDVIELGTIKAHVKKEIVFEYVGDIKINKITVSCGCTQATFDKETNSLKVIYTPGAIPIHLTQAGRESYLSTKRIVVDSENSSDILTFTATVIN